MASFPQGRICWHELLTSDPSAAASFYSRIIGWRTKSWAQDPNYNLWLAGDTEVGGFMELPEDARNMGAPPNWMMYMAVPSCEGAVMRATTLGAKVLVGPQSVPSVGTFAVLQDPEGATFAVLQPAGDVPGHDGSPKQGEFSWHELVTTDWRAGWSFYQGLFGWQEMDSMDMGAAGTYHIWGRMGQMLGGMYNKPPEMPAPPHWLCYMLVPSADGAADAAKLLGAQLLNGPMDVPGGDRVAQLRDPQGAVFAVHSKAAVAQPVAPAPPTGGAVPERRPSPPPARPKPAAAQPAASKRTPAAAPSPQHRRAAPAASKRRGAKKKASSHAPVKKKPVKKAPAKKRASRKKKR